MKKILSSIIAATMMLSLVSCGKKSDVSGNDKEGIFSELIPSDIYSYTLDGECYTSKLASVEIIRETTKDDLYDGTAKLTLDDDNLNRTIELTLHGRKYDTGGWNLESESVDNEVINEWKEKSVEVVAQKYNFSNESSKRNLFSVTKDNNGNYIFKYDVSYESVYLDVSGNIEYIFSRIPKIDSQFTYEPDLKGDKENITNNWKIGGEYHTEDNGFVIKFSKNDANSFNWEAQERWEHVNGGYGYYRDSGTENNDIISWHTGLDETQIEFIITVQRNNYALKFTPSTLYASRTTMGSIPIQYKELIKK